MFRDSSYIKHYAIRLPYKVQVSVAFFMRDPPTYCPASDLFVQNEFIVTPAPETVTFPAPSCDISICVPIGKATEAFVGMVRVIAEAFVRVTSLL